MPLSTQAPATRTALMYLTGGAVIIIWTAVWLIFLLNNPPRSNDTYYFVFGFMATGAVVLFIGLRLGAIGRAAKQAETPQVVQVPVPKAEVLVPAESPPMATYTTSSPSSAPSINEPITRQGSVSTAPVHSADAQRLP